MTLLENSHVQGTFN